MKKVFFRVYCTRYDIVKLLQEGRYRYCRPTGSQSAAGNTDVIQYNFPGVPTASLPDIDYNDYNVVCRYYHL